jgi:hypothetical protein
VQGRAGNPTFGPGPWLMDRCIAVCRLCLSGRDADDAAQSVLVKGGDILGVGAAGASVASNISTSAFG